MKRITIPLAVIAASLALAASTTQGAQGAGAMRDASGLEFTFSMNVKQTATERTGNRPRTYGAAFFRRGYTFNGNKFVMEFAMPAAKGFQRTGTTATFEGAGSVKMYKNGVLVSTSPGTIWASVSDLRASGVPDGAPDHLTFRFTDDGGNPPQQFTGSVLRGDLSVFEITNN